jgi:glutaredoxin
MKIEYVTVYSTTNCAFCKVLKQWLTSKDVEFEEVDVEKEPFMNTRGFSSFPTTVIGVSTKKDNVITGKDIIIKGFNRLELQKVLDI